MCQDFDKDENYQWSKNETRDYLQSLTIRRKNLWRFMKMAHGSVSHPEAYVFTGSVPNNMFKHFTDNGSTVLDDNYASN